MRIKRVLVQLLLMCMVTFLLFGTTMASASVPSAVQALMANEVVSLQAFTTLTFYGQQLYKVEITYANDVGDLKLLPEYFHLYDRGFSHPDFERITIEKVDVNGNVVTLYTRTDTAATGPRSKNPLGLAATSSWYIDKEGTLFYGKDDFDGYANNTTGKGYQARSTLELKFFYEGQTIDDALCLADEKGRYTNAHKWLPTDNGIWDLFKDLEDLVKIPSSSGIAGDYIRAKYFVPDEVHQAVKNKTGERFPLVVSLTGTGTSYWDLNDGLPPNNTNNYGVNLNFDGSVYRWVEQYLLGGTPVIAMTIHDRQVYPGSMVEGTPYKFWEDDYAVVQYFVENFNADPDKIIFTGNSGGTGRTSKINAEYPGLIDVFISCNGNIDRGWLDEKTGGWTSEFTEEDWREVAASGLAIWSFIGEGDREFPSLVQKSIETVKRYYLEAGYSEEWFEDNFRYTLYPSHYFTYWGETDHSATKMTYWYFFDKPYLGPHGEIIDGGQLIYHNPLKPGDTYSLSGVEDGIIGFEYPVYKESVFEWALSRTKTK
jgi:predicted peptidase